MKIYLATRNKGKLQEFKVLAKNTELKFSSLPDEIGDLPEETGSTFQENSYLKANYAFDHCNGIACLADDSGLEVDYLNGSPGIYSARYSPEMTDSSNLLKLLNDLDGVSEERRTARFKCALVLVTGGTTYTAEGSFEGKISTSPKGKNGFGYDPIFIIPNSDKHLAEVEENEKNRISHRALAFQSLLQQLKGGPR